MDRTVFFNIECVLCVAADESDDVDMITPMCPLPTECVLSLTECVLYVAADESDDVDMLTPLIPHFFSFFFPLFFFLQTRATTWTCSRHSFPIFFPFFSHYFFFCRRERRRGHAHATHSPRPAVSQKGEDKNCCPYCFFFRWLTTRGVEG